MGRLAAKKSRFNTNFARLLLMSLACIRNWRKEMNVMSIPEALSEYLKNTAYLSEWDGEGFPPVGCECEIKRIADWMPVTIRFISDYHTVFTTFGGTEDCYETCSLLFRPIRSEADEKKEAAIFAIAEL